MSSDTINRTQEETHYDTRFRSVLSFILKYGMIWVLILLGIGASIAYPGFLRPANLNDMISQVAPTAIVALGMTFVIIGGGFDLSVGAIFAAASVSYASLSNHLPLALAFVLTVLLGIAFGLINGLIITLLRLNPFIATLSTSSLYVGGTYIVSKNLPVNTNNPSFGFLGSGTWGSIWVSVYVLTAMTLVAGLVLSRTTYGRAIYAVGGSNEAARLAGLRVKLLITSTYMLTGACAAIAGMITASQIGVGQPTLGVSVTLNSIAIVIIGGTSLMGGEGGIWRTVIGILIWAMISNLFASLALSTGAQDVMIGGIVLVAVAIDTWSRLARR